MSFVLRINDRTEKRHFFAAIRMLTRDLRMHVFNQNVNVFDLQFQGKKLESNTLAKAHMKSVVFVGTAETTQTDYTNHDNVKECQDM